MPARILVVDDVNANVRLLEAKLTVEYFDVVTARNGQEALDRIEDSRPDIVLLDVMMPGMDGFEVCRRIRSNAQTMHLPVVMITALSEPADRVRGLEAGADDFLTKPVDDVSLFARVKSLVRLKMMMDELRLRRETSEQFGVSDDTPTMANEDADHARILVVDDSRLSIKRLETMLGSDWHEVVVRSDIEVALEEAQAGDYSLIIVDHGRRQLYELVGWSMTDTPQVLLAHHLKTLKLPTFLRDIIAGGRSAALLLSIAQP